MVTRALDKGEKTKLIKLGERIRDIILIEKGYKSLDAFSLEFSDLIAKPTLYQICDGKRDMKLSTLLRLSKALDISLLEIISD
jgi:hypothetical protein